MILGTNEPTFTILGKMKQTVNTKKTLGRVWFRYFQLYGMTDKLTAACAKIGWSQWIENTRDFRAALAAGERLYGMYKYYQAGTPPVSIPELCMYFDIGKTKIYELLRGEKYRYPPKEEVEKKLPEGSSLRELKERNHLQKRPRKSRLPPPLETQFVQELTKLRSFSGPPIPPKENMS